MMRVSRPPEETSLELDHTAAEQQQKEHPQQLDSDDQSVLSTITVAARNHCYKAIEKPSIDSSKQPSYKIALSSNSKLNQPCEEGRREQGRERRPRRLSSRRRRVRFNEDANQYYSSYFPSRSAERDEAEGLSTSSTWYSDIDYDVFRFQMRRHVYQVQWNNFKEQQGRQEQAEEDPSSSLSSLSCKQCPSTPTATLAAVSFAESLEYLLQVATQVNYELLDASKIVHRNKRVQETLDTLYKATNAAAEQRGEENEEKASKGKCPRGEGGANSQDGKEDEEEDACLDWIGLEYYLGAGRCVRRESKERRHCIQEIVSDIQSEYQLGLWTSKTVETELRDSCTQISQTHSLFAQFLAQAQYRATTTN
ncbi:hypothetical protein ACA910_006784 [Epithemia clementina (nom. ined.)]